LQVIKEINAKSVWMNMMFPSGDDFAGVRSQEHPSPEHIPIDFVDIGYVERFDLVGNALPWTSATTLAQPDHGPGKSPLTLGNIRRFAE